MANWIEIRLSGAFERGALHLQDALNWRFRDDNGRRLVCLEETYRGARPRILVPHRPIPVTHANDASTYEKFASWPPQDHYISGWDEMYQHVARLQRTDKEAGFWAAFSLAVMAAPDQVFPKQVQAFVASLADGLPNARVWIAHLDKSYPARVAAIRGLFAAEHTPEVLERVPFEGFPAARGLVSDLAAGLHSYVAPILLGRMPFVLGMNASRGSGIVVVNFGAPRPAVEDLGYSGLYQLFVPRYMSRARLDIGDSVEPDISAEEVDEGLAWWFQRLDALLGVLLDPATFPGKYGVYSSAKHFGTLLSWDRLASTVTGILSYELVDQFVRKMLFFDALDLLAGMGLGDYKKTLSLKRARALLELVDEQAPPPIKKILLGRCSRAVDSLSEMQKGFFLTERIAGDRIRLRSESGGWQEMKLETATAQYLRLVRNSSHSFLGDIQRPFPLSLLASHSGDIPSSLADLPLLYFMQLLLQPQQVLRRRG